MRIENDVKLDFCDVLIKPKRTETYSRSDVYLYRDFKFKNSNNDWHGLPLMIANMDATGTMKMARAVSEYQVQTCLHKHYSAEDLIKFYTTEENSCTYHTWFTLGILQKDFDKFDEVYKHCKGKLINVCIDVANGYNSLFVEKVKSFRDKHPELNIMAGNIATPEMVQELIFNGVDLVKTGIGPGATCITRKVAGVGYPQLSAVIESADVAHGSGGHICSDGGCSTPGDIAKAFGAGADFVMLGSMFAGCTECGGEWVDKEDGMHLIFYGMSSKDAMDKYNGGVANYRAAEGKRVYVKFKGHAQDVVQEILGGLRSACSYVGAKQLKDLSKCTTFIRVNRTHNTYFGD